MSEGAHPPVAEVLPQTGRMVLLTAVVDHAEDGTSCVVEIGEDDPFREAGGLVPAWVGLEYMAQCIAAHGGLIALARGLPLRPGVLLGSRRLSFGVQRFEIDRELRVTARHHRGERGLVAFDCDVRDLDGGSPLVHGRVNVYLVDGWEALEAIGGDAT